MQAGLAAEGGADRDYHVFFTPDQRRRWVRALGGMGLLAFVVFPWCYALVPKEARPGHPLFFLFGVGLDVTGLAYTAVFLVILVHEAGHWFFGRLVGIRINKFVVGTGSAPMRFRWRGIRFSFGPWLRWGYVRSIPARTNLGFGRQLIYLAGGMVAEVVFLAALYLVPAARYPVDSWEHAFAILREFTLISIGIGLWASLWPRMVTIEGRETPNDALCIQKAWANRHSLDLLWQQYELGEEVSALSEDGKYAEAAAMVERIAQLAPLSVEQRGFLATLHAAAQNWDRAMLVHHEAIEQAEPDSLQRANAVDNAATLALQLGRNDELLRLRPLVERAVQVSALPTMKGTLGSILVELGETEAGVELLNRCVGESEADHDRAISNAYLAKAALQLGRKQRAVELLTHAKGKGHDHPLVQRLVKELEPALEQRNG